MSAAKSRRLGWKNPAGRSYHRVAPRTVYEALAPCVCGGCGRVIRPGDLFVRGGPGWKHAEPRRCEKCCGGFRRD